MWKTYPRIKHNVEHNLHRKALFGVQTFQRICIDVMENVSNFGATNSIEKKE